MAYLDDNEGDEIYAKAAWRRQNSARVRLANASTTYVSKGRHRSLRHKGQHAKKSKVEPSRKTDRCTDSKTHWPVNLPDWFRSTLGEQGDFALSTDIWVSSPVSCELELSPRVCCESETSCRIYESEQCNVAPELVFEEVFRRCSADSIHRDSVGEWPVFEARAVDVYGNAPREPGSTSRSQGNTDVAREKVAMVDASSQCDLEDEELGMSRLKIGLFRKAMKSTFESLCSGTCYSVETHFSMFEEPLQMARYAERLSDEELKGLADRFFGRFIAGVKITSLEGRPSRMVAKKHAMEAALIASTSPVFQQSLLLSAKDSLLGGRSSGLLQLAHELPTTWGKLAHTALHWAGQLVKAGALPRAFAAECLRALSELPPSDQGCKMLVMGLFIVVPAVRLSCGTPSSAILSKNPRSQTVGGCLQMYSSQPPLAASMIKRSSSAPSFCRRTRTTGTNLGTESLQKGKVYPCISFDIKGGEYKCELLPDIADDDVPDYWRFANHDGREFPLKMEQLAREAEKGLGYTFCYCDTCLTEYRLPEPIGGMCCSKAVQNERLPLNLWQPHIE
mmetsp:Transcript_12375/g.19665  ORF Transcript_12375/g.19665 Transcript_12375/m.19665 type:complete len:563 (+) Transcript_12375:52-1740(+)